MFIENKPSHLPGRPVNIGFEQENFQVKDIGIEVQKVWPKGKVVYLPNASVDPRDYKVSFSLLKSTFPNFQPLHPLSRGILELRNFLELIGYTRSDYESKRYIRLNEIKNRIGDFA
jgi:hypothetical protein